MFLALASAPHVQLYGCFQTEVIRNMICNLFGPIAAPVICDDVVTMLPPMLFSLGEARPHPVLSAHNGMHNTSTD